MGKFALKHEKIAQEVERLTNRALRQSMRTALRTAIEKTVHDSSNAAVHWMIAEASKSRPASRDMGTVKDLRETKRDGKKHPLVGSVRSHGSNRGKATSGVVDRETELVLRRYIFGHTRSTNFYLYHGLPNNAEITDAQQYADRAKIEAAGLAGARAARRAFFEYLKKGWSTRGGGSDA